MVKTTKTTQWKWIVCFLLLSTVAQTSFGQKIEGFSLAFQTESIALPFSRISPVHPGVEFGLKLKSVTKTHSERSWHAYAGWFYHESMDQNFYLRGEYQFAYKIFKNLKLSVPLGLGYLHSFHSKPVYEQGEDGTFEEKTQMGRPHATIHSGIGVRYVGINTIEPFVKYDIMVQTPFVSTVPVGLRNFLKIGVNINIK
ncbi:MAG: hypothetical protein AAFQ94_29825 [Bacteroidota bacterium]